MFVEEKDCSFFQFEIQYKYFYQTDLLQYMFKERQLSQKVSNINIQKSLKKKMTVNIKNILLSSTTFTMTKACSTKLQSHIIINTVNRTTDCGAIVFVYIKMRGLVKN